MKLVLTNIEAQDYIKKQMGLRHDVQVVIGRFEKKRPVRAPRPVVRDAGDPVLSGPSHAIPPFSAIQSSIAQQMEDFFRKVEDCRHHDGVVLVEGVKLIREFMAPYAKISIYPLKSAVVIARNWEVFKARSREFGRPAQPVVNNSDYPERWV